MRFLLLVVLAVFSIQSLACYVPLVEQIVTPSALLASSKTVVLAKVLKGELNRDNSVRYYFSVEKQFSGRKRSMFSIDGSVAEEYQGGETFTHHHDKAFWLAETGRVSNDNNCEIKPDFVAGGRYLVFIDAPFTRKSFERIVHVKGSEDFKDKWLAYVEDYFAARR